MVKFGAGASRASPPARCSVLFVCMGNICRSPLAEGVFRTYVARAGMQQHIAVDSAGTHDYQLGQPADPRALAAAARRGYKLPPHRARRVGARDFVRFDWILGMDRHNLRELQAMRPEEYEGHLGLLLALRDPPLADDVPDPYYGGTQEFETALDLIEQGADALLVAVRQRLARPA